MGAGAAAAAALGRDRASGAARSRAEPPWRGAAAVAVGALRRGCDRRLGPAFLPAPALSGALGERRSGVPGAIGEEPWRPAAAGGSPPL